MRAKSRFSWSLLTTTSTMPSVRQFALCVIVIWSSRVRAVTQPEFADFATDSRITLSQNRGYKDVLIAIGETVPEDDELIEEIMEVFTEFSTFLYSATDSYDSGVFFEEIRVLIPSSWSDDARYEARTWETFAASDIRVDVPPANVFVNENRPSTNKATSCGAPGQYIHLTPEYVTDNDAARPYGDRSRTLTHEWGHFRWGVFDEYPLPGDDHFYPNTQGTWEATKCVSAITGRQRRAGGDRCTFDPVSGRPDDACRFNDDRGQSETYQASLMYKQFLPEMRTFCDDDVVTGSATALTHNELAPNQQNIQCASRSIWEVMRMHSDFPSEAPKRDLPPIGALPQKSVVPTFRLIRQRRSRDPVVLVLDVSRSMERLQRLHVLRQASYNLITRVLGENQLFGVVRFNHFAETSINLAEVGQDRDRLTKKLPNDADGNTSVGGGIQEGIKVLTRAGVDYNGARMIVLTDGEENRPPKIHQVADSELTNITVHTIAIGPDATQSLEDVANRTGGKTFEHSDRSAALFNIFAQLAIRDVSDVITILSETFVTGNFTRRFSPGVLSDETLTILVGFPKGELAYATVTVRKPNSDVITKDALPAATDTFRSVEDFDLIQIDTEVLSGDWEVVIGFTAANPSNLTSTIHVEAVRRGGTTGGPSSTGGPVSNAFPIEIDAQWGLPNLAPCQIQTVQVTVSEGYTPVADAVVEVTVSRPNATKLAVDVFDDGVGADVRKDDGVYTGFFTEVRGTGRYNMEVSVTGEEGKTRLVDGSRVGQGPAAVDPVLIVESDQQSQGRLTGSFNRFIGGTSFRCMDPEFCTGDEDVYSPYRIIDLRGFLIENMTAVLTFTATGDDLDKGTATYYELRVAKNISDLRNRFNETEIVTAPEDGLPGDVTTPPYVTSGNLSSPLPARNTETFRVKLPDEVGEFSYIFSVVAVDDGGRRSQPSNFASVTANPVRGSPVLAIILIILALLLLLGIIIIVAVLLCRRRKPGEDVESTGSRSMSANGFTRALRSVSGIVRAQVEARRDKNANEYQSEEEGGAYRFVQTPPSVDHSGEMNYAARFTGVTYSTRDDTKTAEKIYVPPSEVDVPMGGVSNPAFEQDVRVDLSPPVRPPPRSHGRDMPEALREKHMYVNDPKNRTSHVPDMLNLGPAGPVLPGKISNGQREALRPAPHPRRPRSEPSWAESGAGVHADGQSDDEHDYDEPPPTGAAQTAGNNDAGSDSDGYDYELVIDPKTGIPYGMPGSSPSPPGRIGPSKQ